MQEVFRKKSAIFCVLTKKLTYDIIKTKGGEDFEM